MYLLKQRSHPTFPKAIVSPHPKSDHSPHIPNKRSHPTHPQKAIALPTHS
ncbi:hypothetical protein [Cuspidothrix issatschenkoi]|nr:hypothetical protein [Cuspidothrix issatschenkoi]